jgi:cytochrome c-type biogenesis protein
MLLLQEVSYLAAFLAGLLSFLSPCILPLVPGYISFITGISLDDLRNKKESKDNSLVRVLIGAIFFIFGFSFVFILLGASATFIGQFLQIYSVWFKRLGGIIIIIFGLHMIGIINIPFLNFQKKFQTGQNLSFNLFITPFLIGFSFAFGWTPCIGPILAAILVYAGTQDTVVRGMTLLSVYSLGLGIPFILTALAVNQFYQISVQIKKYFKIIELIGGILLILIGFFIFSESLTIFSTIFK